MSRVKNQHVGELSLSSSVMYVYVDELGASNVNVELLTRTPAPSPLSITAGSRKLRPWIQHRVKLRTLRAATAQLSETCSDHATGPATVYAETRDRVCRVENERSSATSSCRARLVRSVGTRICAITGVPHLNLRAHRARLHELQRDRVRSVGSQIYPVKRGDRIRPLSTRMRARRRCIPSLHLQCASQQMRTRFLRRAISLILATPAMACS